MPNNKVLMAYGSNSGTYIQETGYAGLSSVEVYDPGTGTFTEILGDDGLGILAIPRHYWRTERCC